MNNDKVAARKRVGHLQCRDAFWIAALCLSIANPFIAHADVAANPNAVTADGGRYYGPLVDGVRQGRGKIEWGNGALYEGEFDHGLFSGEGKYRTGSGYLYEGNYKNGIMTGHGRYVMPDGSIYVGEFRNDMFNGQGRYEMSSGHIYEGMFTNGVFDGKGKLTGPGEEYQGEFKAGQYSGRGEVKYEDGRKYKGEFVLNQYQGKGEFTTSDGLIYEGDFEKNEFTGNGIYKRRDGSQHQGAFVKWRPHGVGTYTDAKGNVYEGTFVDGALTGSGHMIGKDGSRYDGEFKKWLYEGQGVYRYVNGDEYKGAFANGLFEGEGVYTYASAKTDGTTKKSGVWRYGSLEDKEAAQRMLASVEAALYSQRSLLDAAVAALAPHDRNSINLYLLAVGGDGAQEVFHREAEFVREQFDRDFNTRGRSLILVNSRNTVAQLPMATVTSIRESIQAIAGRMDKDKDILFLYLTSHGSADHKLTLDQDGINLRNLDAKELGVLLKESGIRWKVIVVSACYAGGFIEPLHDDHTLVIAAARHDRRSFGCADENDFTYFGRAFFKESLPHSKSFTDAFRNASKLVEKWENADFKAERKTKENNHSEPQISSNQLIEKYLQRWRAQLKTGTQSTESRDHLKATSVEK